jgi:hypothetical protein
MDEVNQSSGYLTLTTYLDRQQCLADANNLRSKGTAKNFNQPNFRPLINALKIKIASYLLV